jgi:hypothetical protein
MPSEKVLVWMVVTCFVMAVLFTLVGLTVLIAGLISGMG